VKRLEVRRQQKAAEGGTELLISVPPRPQPIGRRDMNVADVVLRIVHSKELIGHEEVDPSRVERLVRRLQSDGVLKNPPVVARAGLQHVVLDGVTRVAALRKLGIRDVLVQIVDYDGPGIDLHSWCHVVVGMQGRELMSAVKSHGGLKAQYTDLLMARVALSRRRILCYLMLRDRGVVSVAGGASPEERVALVNEVVGLYVRRAQVYRVMGDDLDALLEEYPDLSAAVVFPCYTCGEIMRTALNGAKLPMGITRHAISGRALGLNVDLVMLDSDIPLEQKNLWLSNLIKSRIKNKRVRFYPESVFRFDE
jgi:hypothetical protein